MMSGFLLYDFVKYARQTHGVAETSTVTQHLASCQYTTSSHYYWGGQTKFVCYIYIIWITCVLLRRQLIALYH